MSKITTTCPYDGRRNWGGLGKSIAKPYVLFSGIHREISRTRTFVDSNRNISIWSAWKFKESPRGYPFTSLGLTDSFGRSGQWLLREKWKNLSKTSAYDETFNSMFSKCISCGHLTAILRITQRNPRFKRLSVVARVKYFSLLRRTLFQDKIIN